MKVLVDTCIWSQVLRHKSPDAELTGKLQELIRNAQVAVIGPSCSREYRRQASSINLREFRHE